MAYFDSQEWSALQKLIQRGRENPERRPLLWVGAGLSVAAGYPTTGQLIERLRGELPGNTS